MTASMRRVPASTSCPAAAASPMQGTTSRLDGLNRSRRDYWHGRCVMGDGWRSQTGSCASIRLRTRSAASHSALTGLGPISSPRRSITRARSGASGTLRAAPRCLPTSRGTPRRRSQERQGHWRGGQKVRAKGGCRYRLRWTRRKGRRCAAAAGSPGGALAPRPLRGRRIAWKRGEEDGEGNARPRTRSTRSGAPCHGRSGYRARCIPQ